MPNDETISNTPMTISQMPTTDGQGHDRFERRCQHDDAGDQADHADEDLPAAAGQVGSLIAETVVATPRKMKPTPIQMASSRMRSSHRSAGSQHRQDQRRRAADEQQHPPAGRDMQAEREDHLRDAGDQQSRRRR